METVKVEDTRDFVVGVKGGAAFFRHVEGLTSQIHWFPPPLDGQFLAFYGFPSTCEAPLPDPEQPGKVDAKLYDEAYFTRSPYAGYPAVGGDWNPPPKPEYLPVIRASMVKAHAVTACKIYALAQPKSVLDIGCAYGYVVKYLREMGVEAVGLDLSRYAAGQDLSGWFVLGSAPDLPFKDEAFDLAFTAGTLEHIPELMIPQVFKEMSRVSRERILSVSFEKTPSEYHLTCRPLDWWFRMMPPNSYLYRAEGCEGPFGWFYKGEIR